MPFTAKEESGNFERPDPIPAGMHLATCYGVFDIGTQVFNYLGKERRVRKAVFMFEVPAERIDVEKNGEKLDLPRAISCDHPVSLGKKSNLRPVLESWRGRAFTEEELKGFDLFSVIGAPCMLNVTHGVAKAGHPFAKISNIVPMIKGMEKPKQENPSVRFSFDEKPEWPLVFPEGMPEWVQKQIEDSLEYKEELNAMTAQEPATDQSSDSSTPAPPYGVHSDDVEESYVPF